MSCSEDLFEWNNRLCTTGHFQSMLENNMIESTVIDTWSYLLNENEILRDEYSPLRLFMTSETTVIEIRFIFWFYFLNLFLCGGLSIYLSSQTDVVWTANNGNWRRCT